VTIRRILLSALTAALVAGPLGTTAANASFADSASLGTTMSVTSATVAAPGSVVGALACTSPNATMSATWAASTSTRVSGYLVSVYFSDGFVQTVQLGSTATSWSASIAIFNVTAYKVQYSVTTQTSYGWTKESAKTAWFQC
jgi:hypothetical protein